MKRFLSIVLFTMISANPTLAQDTPTTPTTTSGGGLELTIQDSKGTRKLRDTTTHTTLSDGTVVSGSTGSDGEPNGGAGNGDGGSGDGGTTGVSREGE